MADDKKKAAPAKPGTAPKAKAAKPAAEAAPGAPAKKPAKAKPAEAAAGEAPRAEDGPKRPVPKPRLADHYAKKVRPALMEKFGYTSTMQAPRFEKIVLNMGVGDAIQDQKLLDAAANELGQITGQKPAIRRAKKSIANFKLREGLAIGCMVTLRGARMWEFYDRLINVAVPRIRDFRGLNPRSFDGRGNYTMGVTEQIIFPEINLDKVGKIRGMDVTIVTSAKSDEEGRELLRLMQMPFRLR
ncbi:MAG: 50S ribosomal protein L5 [Candidatus Eisenbacteria bacterium]|uniref:Large ribosomal subunit protein uL5 n=1 Tax=Eiseniibacteriota bacterium TaxID=2212470 RepID=A0A9D6L5E7_UNCEI|nr:50S ribosomal protein L5 [Candidatus Eisenbacteria bacterium]MBI3538936.1 50S ribosomal protein L5 [Candidatus Eisenbacteria bacterium]